MINCTLDDGNPEEFGQIYCSCGRFVDIDYKVLQIKKSLHKALECSYCRNRRIAKELELLDEHFSVIEEPIYS